mgnify:CR=1 FL=1
MKKRAHYPGNTNESLKEFTAELGEFFYSGDYGPEMIKLLRVVLDGERVPYKGHFNNKLIKAILIKFTIFIIGLIPLNHSL